MFDSRIFMRYLLPIIMAAAVSLANIATHAAEKREAVAARDTVSVSSRSVRLGDIFANAGELADKQIARAPTPGERVVLDARALYKLASAHGLAWQPTREQNVVIERQSDLLTDDILIDYVLNAMDRDGLDASRIELSMHTSGKPVYVASEADVAVDSVRYDEIGNRFSAVVTARVQGEAVQRVGLTGRAYRVVKLPVVIRPMRNGDVIRAEDVAWQVVRQQNAPRGAITDPQFLIGLTPQRVLRANTPIRARDLGRPILVKRNSLVTLMLQTETMVLAMRGKALEDAAEGQAVRVRNPRGGAIVEGVVTGQGDVLLDMRSPARNEG
jgi:flagella basal body P-ring formation protein FlgA